MAQQVEVAGIQIEGPTYLLHLVDEAWKIPEARILRLVAPAGDDLRLDQISPVEYHPERIFLTVPGFGKQDVQWIVRGKGKATVTFRSLKAKDQSISFDL